MATATVDVVVRGQKHCSKRFVFGIVHCLGMDAHFRDTTTVAQRHQFWGVVGVRVLWVFHLLGTAITTSRIGHVCVSPCVGDMVGVLGGEALGAAQAERWALALCRVQCGGGGTCDAKGGRRKSREEGRGGRRVWCWPDGACWKEGWGQEEEEQAFVEFVFRFGASVVAMIQVYQKLHNKVAHTYIHLPPQPVVPGTGRVELSYT